VTKLERNPISLCWVRSRPVNVGQQRAGAVTRRSPDVHRNHRSLPYSPLPPRMGETGETELESPTPDCREPSGLLPTKQWVTKDGPHPLGELGAVAARCEHRRLADRATRVPQAAVTSGM
jgi:hypothetical protein